MKAIACSFAVLLSCTLYYTTLFASASPEGNTLAVSGLSERGYQRIQINIPEGSGALTKRAVDVFRRVLKARTGRDYFLGSGKPLMIQVKLDSIELATEAYSIRSDEKKIIISGGDENGILYGLGKFLHTSNFSPEAFTPSDWRGTSAPEKPFRDIYFATHFGNFYHKAPIEAVKAYVEELALWGYNGVMVWFDMHHFTGIDDPEAQAMLDRLAEILRAGDAVGMKTDLTLLANEGYKTSPKALRADPNTSSGYHFGVEICPSVPGGTELILKQVKENMQAFKVRGVTIDRVSLWPYDQGGCACDQCSPWGANGFLRITRDIAALLYEEVPGIELIMSTWLFDFKEQDLGEWRGLARAFETEKPWVDYIMADSHTTFPSYPMTHPIPGGLPLLNFPEISMWGNWPWGGYGANPLPERFQRLWNQVADKVSGGYPYSEGIFEDANKVMYSQFYWGNTPASESLNEYVSFAFSPVYADQIMEAIDIMEKNYGMSTSAWARNGDAPKKIVLSEADHGARKAYETLANIDKKLPEPIRKSWRWRLLLLRSFLDYELRLSKGLLNEKINNAFREIRDIQYLNEAEYSVYPPVDAHEIYPMSGNRNKNNQPVF